MRALILVPLLTPLAFAQDTDVPPPLEQPPGFEIPFTGEMTAERLGELIRQIDASASAQGNGYRFQVADRDMMTVYDETANRMRIISPIIPADGLPPELLMRMLQANFDAVLDVRYAIGNGNVWSTFVHPLSTLTDQDFLSAIAQTAVAAETFGTTFSSGVFVFGGGDTQSLHEDLLRRLEEATNSEDDRGI